MIIFNEKVFDGYITGLNNVYTNVVQADVLGSADIVSYSGQVLQVQGTGVSIAFQTEVSFDGARWMNNYTAIDYSTLLPTGSDSELATFSSNSAVGASGLGAAYVRLRIFLSGTSPSGLLRLFAVGRSS